MSQVHQVQNSCRVKCVSSANGSKNIRHVNTLFEVNEVVVGSHKIL